MGILGGKEIVNAVERGDIVVDPFEPANVNPVSLDLRLGSRVSVYDRVVRARLNGEKEEDGSLFDIVYGTFLDMSRPNEVVSFDITPRGWMLRPGILYLMHTQERILARKHVPILDGKSSIGRLGVKIHETAGFGDPGFDGQYTLEVTVVQPVRVYAGARFCQIRFHEISGEFGSYGGDRSNYKGDLAAGPVPSRAWRMFEK